MTQQLLEPIKEADGELLEVIFQFVKASLEGLRGLVSSFISFGDGYFGAEADDRCSYFEHLGVFLD